ncbi:hypothetical protein [Streptomyces tendae]|nr:hypothetical protein [Streptomyces sp. S10(2018)]
MDDNGHPVVDLERGIKNVRRGAARCRTHAVDHESARRLWELSEELIKVSGGHR